MKLQDWVSTENPPIKVFYDVRNPPSSDVLATRTYAGPRLDVCGNPTLILQSNG